MHAELLSFLCCPFCGGELLLRDPVAAGETTEVEYGMLECTCSTYPVVAGIPILKRDVPEAVLGHLAAQDHEKAVVELLLGRGTRSLARLIGLYLSRKKFTAGAGRLIRRLAELPQRNAIWTGLVAERTHLSAEDFLERFYHPARCVLRTRANIDTFNHFLYRYSQPRHLVALSFFELVRDRCLPILDLACGAGHLTYNLRQSARGRMVIGADTNFAGLYVAKLCMVPEAEFVCCDGEDPLPFRDESFAAAFCTDAFHYLRNKAGCAREACRVIAADGLVGLISLRNRNVPYAYGGIPLRPEDYCRLFQGMPHRVLSDSCILQRYLRRQGLDLSRSTSSCEAAAAPLVSLAASRDQALFQEQGRFDSWPHARGRLAMNPLYQEDVRATGSVVKLSRKIPSDFYLRDNPEMKDYLPESLTVPRAVLDGLTQGAACSAEAASLIDSCAFLGVPPRYLREPDRPTLPRQYTEEPVSDLLEPVSNSQC